MIIKLSKFILFSFLLVNIQIIAQNLSTDDFVTTWKTDNPGTSNDNQITIPVHPSSTYNYNIDWNNDGIIDEYGITGSVTHTYNEPGTYTIRISGNFPRIYFKDAFDKEKIVSIDQWGTQAWTSMGDAFKMCYYLRGNAIDVPDLSNLTDMSFMLSNTSFNQNINNWNTSNVTHMNSTFLGADNFNQPLDNWNTANVTDMQFMFCDSGFNKNLNNWDTSNVTNMIFMFSSTSFNGQIGNWDTSNVTNMNSMFSYARDFNQDIGNWNTSNVTNMRSMFVSAFSFNQDIGNWNISNVTNLAYMFSTALIFNQPLDNWDTSNVTDMDSMFRYAGSFDQDIGNWNIFSLTSAKDMFKNITLSTGNYDALLIGWQAQPHNNGVFFHGGESIPELGLPARESLALDDSWKITDGAGTIAEINDEKLAKLVIYPNPSNGIFNIELGSSIGDSSITYSVTNATGQIIIKETPISFINNSFALDLSTLNTGVYFIKLNIGANQFIKRILKK